MIPLTRLGGSVFALNSDLIERVDSTPDTVVTLVDGSKYVVRESLHEVVSAVRAYRGGVIAESARVVAEAQSQSLDDLHAYDHVLPETGAALQRHLVAVPGDLTSGSPREER